MKTSTRSIRLLAYSLCLVAGLYNCKTKDVDSLTPFTYSFGDLDNIKLPDLKETTPAPVLVTEATSTPSAKAGAVGDGLKAAVASGIVPDAVQQASNDVSKVFSEQQATALADGLSADVLNAFDADGTLPASVGASVETLFKNETMKGYLPTVTPAMVNGKVVSARISATPIVIPPLVVLNSVTSDTEDKCKKEANTAYNKALNNLNTTQRTQTATVNATYKQRESAAKTDNAGCRTSITAKYKALLDADAKTRDQNLANLQNARKTLGEVNYHFLVAQEKATYAKNVLIHRGQRADELKACDDARDAKILAAADARDKDLANINTTYNNLAASLTTALNKAIVSCHNQGNGG